MGVVVAEVGLGNAGGTIWMHSWGSGQGGDLCPAVVQYRLIKKKTTLPFLSFIYLIICVHTWNVLRADLREENLKTELQTAMYGIRGNALKWLESYLRHRQQCVEISGQTGNQKLTYRSQYRENNCGVPQGTILGPLLFLLYVNDLPSVTYHKCILYADDTTLSIINENDDIIEYQNEINMTLNKIITWLEHNNLHININKTKMIQFQTYNSKRPRLKVQYGNETIEEVDYAKFLGIKIDKYCNWKSHIDDLCKRIDKFVFALYRLTRVASVNAALCAYHGYVSSILRYGIIIWGYFGWAYKISCFELRKNAYAQFVERTHWTGVFNIHLHIFEICIYVHQIKHAFELYNDVVSRPSRKVHMLNVPRRRIKLFSNNVYCMSITVYNKLPDDFKTLSLRTFKCKLFNFLLSKCYYSSEDFMNEKFT